MPNDILIFSNLLSQTIKNEPENNDLCACNSGTNGIDGKLLVITLQQLGRFGNLLSQYALARTLAERWGYALEVNRIFGFPGTATAVDGERVVSPRVGWGRQWPSDVYSARRVEVRELMEAPNAHLTLHGWFQRFELIAERAEDVREDWLRLEDPLPERAAGDFLICLRLTDYAADRGEKEDRLDTLAHSTLTEDEVRRLVRTVKHSRLHIVTDEPGHAMFERLRDLGGTLAWQLKQLRFD